MKANTADKPIKGIVSSPFTFDTSSINQFKAIYKTILPVFSAMLEVKIRTNNTSTI